MIPMQFVLAVLAYIFMGICAAACIYGYHLLGSNTKRGHGLMALGSAGWALAAPNTFFLIQSLFFLAVASIGYARARKSTANKNR